MNFGCSGSVVVLIIFLLMKTYANDRNEVSNSRVFSNFLVLMPVFENGIEKAGLKGCFNLTET